MKLAFLRHRAKSRGQALVETALVLPLFVLLLLITIDFGRIYFSYIQINNAAREGANYAAVDPANNLAIAAAAKQETDAQAQGGESAIQIPAPVCKDPAGTVIACSTAKDLGSGPGNTITVTVNETFSFITPFVNNFWANNFTMSTAATSTVFGFVASGSSAPPGGCSAPVADFTVVADATLKIYANPSISTPTSGTCAISGYNWTWGDGNDEVGAATGDYHTYASANTYTVTLLVTNQGGSSTKVRMVTVPAPPPPPVCAKPTPAFSYTTTGNGANTIFTYRDGSTVADSVNCPITNWLWTFTDLGTQSNAQNPAPFKYNTGGSHSVTLQVTNAGGSASVTHS
jgi:PKD repeat protein